MTIIPQDPFIFTGTVRDNLDPLQQQDEFSVWDLVNKLGLQSLITKLGGIRAQICDESISLSVGEKQLICLMRAILRNSKVIPFSLLNLTRLFAISYSLPYDGDDSITLMSWDSTIVAIQTFLIKI